MDTTRNTRMVRLDLTEVQKTQVRASTGIAADAIELTVEELEERIQPKLGVNHNETLLIDG